MRSIYFAGVLCCGFLALSAPALAQAPKADAPKTDAPKAEAPKAEAPKDRAALEKEFEETMTGSVLVGYFTTKSPKEAKPPAEERYTITKVSKLQGDVWLFLARVQYGERDVTVPMPLEVKWAGDTPVITLTDFTIPKLGTYTARVMIYRGQYAGTWSHGDVGGHLWGRIERAPADAPEAPKKEPEKKADAKKE
jgi:hypothetical protein